MSHLIAAPLTASCEAQSMLGDTMIKFINMLAYLLGPSDQIKVL